MLRWLWSALFGDGKSKESVVEIVPRKESKPRTNLEPPPPPRKATAVQQKSSQAKSPLLAVGTKTAPKKTQTPV